MGRGWWWKVALLAVAVAVWRGWQGGGWDREESFRLVREWSEKLGIWAIPLYVSVHTISIALCLPSAIFFETAAPLLFGFFPSVLCVFSAKILAASLSFSIGRCKIEETSKCTHAQNTPLRTKDTSRFLSAQLVSCLVPLSDTNWIHLYKMQEQRSRWEIAHIEHKFSKEGQKPFLSAQIHTSHTIEETKGRNNGGVKSNCENKMGK
ncbi:uncharacterized protein LOC106758644 isoform X3 [Vigna radiata var. radiata]|uniref:Uncharacterized protein LOC106758644 isoform X3 n=1 Tax=Vigna radiata var. radiata TaxID=3916 RepID=A0A3Q0EXG4_VIGRR|nr:uncharacterized protein LOC106758644 isoform X3 [Vigna radiata var. radiata]